MSHPDTPLPMSNAEWATRLRRSHQALSAWRWEAGLPWVDRQLTRAIAEHELDALRYFVPFMPVKLRAEVPPLVEAWDAFRATLL